MNGFNYNDYLQLDQLLNAQKSQSEIKGNPCHDEHLFIITHQAYELWFKQIIIEIDSILKFFNHPYIDEKNLGLVAARLCRIKEIQQTLFSHFNILKTMTPMDFLEFRDLLHPASGLQSLQFRIIEIKLGLKLTDRHQDSSKAFYFNVFSESEKNKLKNLEQEKTLLELVNSWLERNPFLSSETQNFHHEFKEAIYSMFQQDEKILKNNPHLDEKSKNIQLQLLNKSRNHFECLLDPEKFNEYHQSKSNRLTHKATMGALFILLYRHEPILQLPFEILTHLMDIDEHLMTWRYRHSLLAQRMLGTKIGTGGTAGHEYLSWSIQHNRLYPDLFELTTFLLPHSRCPKLKPELIQQMGFTNEKNL